MNINDQTPNINSSFQNNEENKVVNGDNTDNNELYRSVTVVLDHVNTDFVLKTENFLIKFQQFGDKI